MAADLTDILEETIRSRDNSGLPPVSEDTSECPAWYGAGRPGRPTRAGELVEHTTIQTRDSSALEHSPPRGLPRHIAALPPKDGNYDKQMEDSYYADLSTYAYSYLGAIPTFRFWSHFGGMFVSLFS